jgi:hypothetical protein
MGATDSVGNIIKLHAEDTDRAAKELFVRGRARAEVDAAERHGQQRHQRAAQATGIIPEGTAVNHFLTDSDASSSAPMRRTA